MAHVTPAAVHEGTQTSGLSDYTLTGSPEDGRRTLAQAVTEGDAANSDTVSYYVTDNNTGASLEFEYGTGTISSGGAAVSRDTIHQSSNGGAKVSWPAGGTRAFIVTTSDWALTANNGSDYTAATFATNLGLPRLSTANIFTLSQTVQKSTVPEVVIDHLDTSSFGAIEFKEGGVTRNSVYSIGSAFATAARRDNLELVSRNGGIDFSVGSSGSRDVQIDSAGVLKTSAGNKYDAFPSGTKLLFGATPPAGWTRVNETQSRVIRLAKSGDTIGSTGGSDDIFDGLWTTAATTLTESQIPAHTHSVRVSTSGTGTATNVIGDLSADATGSISGAAESTGGGGSHNHSMNTPYYYISCWATKD